MLSLSTVLELIDLVVERLEADPQLARCGGLVAVVLLQDRLDVFHFDIAERWGPLGKLEVGRPDRSPLAFDTSERQDRSKRKKKGGKMAATSAP